MKAVIDLQISTRLMPVGECYTWYVSIWEGLRCELALLRDGPLCWHLTCTFLSSTFKLTDPVPVTKRGNVAWRAFRAEFCFCPLTCEYLSLAFIPIARNRGKMYSSLSRGWFALRIFFFPSLTCIYSIMAHRYTEKFQFSISDHF